jgi:TetR/AcrR family transcriptional regulator, repressor for uid operon
MPRLAADTTQLRRRRILDAAGRCFVRRGIGATSMRDIFDEAGVSAGGAYSHFASKHEIVETFIAEAQQRDDAMILACVIAGDRAATLRAFFTLAIADFSQADALQSIRLDISSWAEAIHDKAIAKLMQAAVTHTVRTLATMVARSERRTRVKAGDVATARALGALVIGTAVGMHLDPGLSASRLAKVLSRVVEPGLGAPEES